jgi:hypothetical protein
LRTRDRRGGADLPGRAAEGQLARQDRQREESAVLFAAVGIHLRAAAETRRPARGVHPWRTGALPDGIGPHVMPQ